MLINISKSGVKDLQCQIVNSISISVQNPMWQMTELLMILVQLCTTVLGQVQIVAYQSSQNLTDRQSPSLKLIHFPNGTSSRSITFTTVKW